MVENQDIFKRVWYPCLLLAVADTHTHVACHRPVMLYSTLLKGYIPKSALPALNAGQECHPMRANCASRHRTNRNWGSD
jgi:hypothetical protein